MSLVNSVKNIYGLDEGALMRYGVLSGREWFLQLLTQGGAEYRLPWARYSVLSGRKMGFCARHS